MAAGEGTVAAVMTWLRLKRPIADEAPEAETFIERDTRGLPSAPRHPPAGPVDITDADGRVLPDES